jgi:hypothetical protein
MFLFHENHQMDFDRAATPGGAMTKAEVRKLRSADLRLIASRAREPERERKMLALAERLEELERDKRERERPNQ